MTGCIAQEGIEHAVPAAGGRGVFHSGIGKGNMVGGQGGVLHRTVVHAGQTFDVSWLLLTENNKSYGWRWTNKEALKKIVKLEKIYKADGQQIFTFKVLGGAGDQRIEFTNERPSQAHSDDAEGLKAFYMTIVG